MNMIILYREASHPAHQASSHMALLLYCIIALVPNYIIIFVCPLVILLYSINNGSVKSTVFC